jgi:hypothetical protein
MTDTRTAPVRTPVTVMSTHQWYGVGPWRDASDSRLFGDFEPFAGGTAVFPQRQGQDDRVCSFGGSAAVVAAAPGVSTSTVSRIAAGSPEPGDEHAVAGGYG